MTQQSLIEATMSLFKKFNNHYREDNDYQDEDTKSMCGLFTIILNFLKYNN
jgi:hypothetical protein